MNRDHNIDYAKNFEATSKKRIAYSYGWLAVGLIAVVLGTIFQEYGLIFGGWLSFLIMALYRDMGVLYLTVGKLLGEVQSAAEQASERLPEE